MIKTILVCSVFASGIVSSSCAAAGSGQVNSAPTIQNTGLSAVKNDKPESGGQFADDKSKALDAFIAQNYQGWKINGVASGDESRVCQEGSPCDLQLINAKQSKILTVIVKRFYKSDNSAYWLVYEARTIDAAMDKTGLADDEK